jgi:hypothetical protein
MIPLRDGFLVLRERFAVPVLHEQIVALREEPLRGGLLGVGDAFGPWNVDTRGVRGRRGWVVGECLLAEADDHEPCKHHVPSEREHGSLAHGMSRMRSSWMITPLQESATWIVVGPMTARPARQPVAEAGKWSLGGA